MDPQIEAVAHERLQAAESEQVTRKTRVTLGMAFAEFWKHPSPWLITGSGATAIAFRFARGDWRWTDALVPAILLATFPVVEWLIHVFILHWRPRKVAGVVIDSELASKHRAHHRDPRDLPLVFIPWRSLIGVIVGLWAIAAFVFPRFELGLTYVSCVAIIGIVYEWMHYLIHGDYIPKGTTYKAVWRAHRLHHYRNEHYWFTVTTTGTADRLFGTLPKEPTSVPKSATAKNLHGSGITGA
jgi:hypothetical protein